MMALFGLFSDITVAELADTYNTTGLYPDYSGTGGSVNLASPTKPTVSQAVTSVSHSISFVAIAIIAVVGYLALDKFKK